MRIAVEGCAHGCLEEIYRTIEDIEKRHGYKVDLLLCCGDFQSVRNLVDLKTMACPDKFKSTGSFYKYFTGELKAPILTLFIGGNHEASNYLQELPYGGWVAPNIYFLGKASVVNVGGIRIGGLSGIYKSRDYNNGHFEHLPYNERTLRSVYHIRNLEVFRMKQLAASPPDILLSHDWPCGITDHGDVEQLLRFKPFFRKDIENNALGSPPCMELLRVLKPQYWFSGHLHVKFSALVKHNDSELETKFLALDKCLPKRRFLQIIDFPNSDCGPQLSHDPKWLAILKSTNDLLSVNDSMVHMPGPGYNGRYDYSPTLEEIEFINKIFNNDLVINENTFSKSTKNTFQRPDQVKKDLFRTTMPSTPVMNSQTTSLCDKLEIHDPVRLAMEQKSGRVGINDLKDFDINQQKVHNEDEIVLSDEEETPPKELEEKSEEQTLPPLHHQSDNESFFIDTTPSLTESPEDEEPKPKKKFIKRRNKSIYNSVDE